MAKTGDSYIIALKRPHLEWGTYRFTNSRGLIYGEGYIPIPADESYNFDLLNSNGTGGKDILGKNMFYCISKDGLFESRLRAQGSQSDGFHAKQLAGDKNLKALGTWFSQIDAQEGDKIRVTWIDSQTIQIEHL